MSYNLVYQNSTQKNSQYELPDGKIINIGSQKYRAPEALFNPMLAGKELKSFPELVYNSIMLADVDIRRSLYENIVLSGGTTMYPGLSERLGKELVNMVPAAMRVKVVSSEERKYSVWIGGSILSSLSTFQSSWVTKKEYEETGSHIVHRKCF